MILSPREKQSLARAHKVLEIAQRICQEGKHCSTFQAQNHLEEIHIHDCGYAETGYNPVQNLIVTGNWNEPTSYHQGQSFASLGPKYSNLFERLGKIFEKLGFDTEWSDEWTTCEDCSRLFRTQPDSFNWKPSGRMDLDKGICKCNDCWEEENEDES